MGLFSASKRITVSSVVYNLGGDPTDRPDFLRSTVAAAAVSSNRESMARALVDSYRTGPGIQFRSFGRWARNSGYDSTVGLAAGTIGLFAPVDRTALVPLIPHAASEIVLLQTVEIGVADYTYWADRYLSDNAPDQLGTAYTVDFAEATQTVTIHLAGGGTVSFVAEDYSTANRYLYASYYLGDAATTGPVVTGSTVTLGGSDGFPSTAGWTLDSYVDHSGTHTLSTRTQSTSTYSDGRPSESSDTTTYRNEAAGAFDGVWEVTEFQGRPAGDYRNHSLRKIMYQHQDAAVTDTTSTSTGTETLADGTVKTTTTTVTNQVLVLNRTYRVDTQDIIDQGYRVLKVFIYRYGSGNAALDALFRPYDDGGTFLPYIPLRVNNVFISPSFAPDIYGPAKKALKKACRASYDELVTKIQENPSLGDIDFAYVAFGVPLNTQDNPSRRYIYEFFQEIMLGRGASIAEFTTWRSNWLLANQENAHWFDWQRQQGYETEPLYGTPEPATRNYPPPPAYDVRVVSARPGIGYDMTVYWSGIEETVGSGQLKAGAQPGELWFETLSSETFEQKFWVVGTENNIEYPAYTIDHVRLNWQVDGDTWRRLDIYGLAHRNMVYGGKSVDTPAAEALADTDESGFLIPLHETIFRRMPLREATQLAGGCCYLIFNCYKIVKQKWYQTTWFKVLLVVAIIVITVASGGAGGSSVGLLGTNAAVGAALGYTGTAAVIAGAIANAVAATIVTQLIGYASTALFGEKIGAIVTLVVTAVTMTVGTSMAQGGDFSTALVELSKADNLIKLASVTSDGLSSYMKGEAQEILQKTQGMLTSYNEQSQRLAELYEQNIGSDQSPIDPLLFTGSATTTVTESPDSFLSRTLMTGGEVAEMSFGLITGFADITLQPNLSI